MVIKSLLKKLRSTVFINRRREQENAKTKNLLNSHKILSLSLFLSFAILVIFICFVGLSPAGPQILPDQIARIRIVAETSFSYESIIHTQSIINSHRRKVSPIYRLDSMPFENISTYIEKLIPELNELDKNIIYLYLKVN